MISINGAVTDTSSLPPEVVLIWAQARDADGRPVIGAGNDIPWRVPEDFTHFRELTRGHPVVMGQRTWESLPRRPLSGRTNVVLTDDPAWSAVGAVVAESLPEALALAAKSPGGEQVWVIGGGTVYRQAIEYANRLEVTEIDVVVEGDTFAPVVDPEDWAETASDWMASEVADAPRYRFRTLNRR